MGLLFFADRTRKADDYPWLAWKVRLFTAGAVLAVFGMVRDDNRILAVATVVLLAGFLLRFLPGGTGVAPPEEDEDPWASWDSDAEGARWGDGEEADDAVGEERSDR